MRDDANIAVVIPALNEEHSIGKVLDAIPQWVDEVVVADNGSTDNTVEVARAHGARVVVEPRRGYGSACLKGIAALDHPDIVVFLDGDFSDHPEQMDTLVDPIVAGEVDLVIGSRVLGRHEPGALTLQARTGNRLACSLIRLFWGVRYSDLGPFRAVRYSTLQALDMSDPDYGWTVEMQIKAALQKVPCVEVPADYRKRIGKSKVSGTVRGILGAGYKILSTIFLSALRCYLGKTKASAGPDRLIIFTRYPEPGKTKTRLIPALGPEGAAELQRNLTEHAVATAVDRPRRGVSTRPSLEVRFAGATRRAMENWLGSILTYRPQGEGDLGGRMARAFRETFHSGIDHAVLMGIDCPELTAGILLAAFDALKQHDIVLGPATDGGYYLIGLRRKAMNRAIPAIFKGIEWGTGDVFEKTLKIVRSQGLRLYRLAPLEDIDRPEDLPVWERARQQGLGGTPKPLLRGAKRRGNLWGCEGGLGSASDETIPPGISVIIPTLNEAKGIRQTVAPIQKVKGVEILVVDGGSDDGTQEILRQLGVTVIQSPRGRATQMNLGAAKASGDVLLFLHADTRLPEGFEKHAYDVLGQPDTIAGSFRFSTDDPTRTMNFIGFWVNWRSQRLHMPYGDQALFLKKDVFREIGGYPEIPIMEDFELARRLSRRGRIRIAPAAVVTSARRWREVGKWRTVMYNQIAVTAYLLGVSPPRIATFYSRWRGVR